MKKTIVVCDECERESDDLIGWFEIEARPMWIHPALISIGPLAPQTRQLCDRCLPKVVRRPVSVSKEAAGVI